MSIGDIKNKAKQATPKQFFGVLGIVFLVWIVGSMLFGCDNSCKKNKAKTCKKGRIEQGFDATKRAGEGAVGIVKGAGEGAVGIVKGAGNVVEKAAQSTRQSIFGRSAEAAATTEVETATTEVVQTAEVVEEATQKTEEPAKAAATTEETIVATSNAKAAAAVTATTPAAATTTESKTVVTEEIIKKKIIVEVEFQTPDGKVLGSKDVAIDEEAVVVEAAATTEAVIETKEVQAVVATPAKTDSPIDAKIEQLQKEIEKLNAAKSLLEDLK